MNQCVACSKQTSNPKFCSRHCSAVWTNKRYPKRAPEGKCLECGIPISASLRYCCLDHKTKYRQDRRLPRKTRDNYNEHMKGYMLDRYYRRKAAAIKQLGGKCVRCGGVEELQFDHIERAGKGWSIGNRLAGVSEKRLQEELAKCQLLCGQCHKEKTTTEPDQYNSYVRECCGKQWTGRQYAGHRSWNHTSRRNSIWQKP